MCCGGASAQGAAAGTKRDGGVPRSQWRGGGAGCSDGGLAVEAWAPPAVRHGRYSRQGIPARGALCSPAGGGPSEQGGEVFEGRCLQSGAVQGPQFAFLADLLHGFLQTVKALEVGRAFSLRPLRPKDAATSVRGSG